MRESSQNEIPASERAIRWISQRYRRAKNWIMRQYRRARYQWLRRGLLKDAVIAVGLFLFVFFGSLFLPSEPHSFAGGPRAVTILVPTTLMLLITISFWKVCRFLSADSAFEDLRTANRPTLNRFFILFVQLPCTAVVAFALFAGLTLWAIGFGGIGPALRGSLLQVTTPVPPLASVLRTLTGVETESPWSGWFDFGLSLLYTLLVFNLIIAWFQRGNQRHNFVASLFTAEDRDKTPYGHRLKGLNNEPLPEPHEQVLMMRATRIGSACLPYLQVELSGEDWRPNTASASRCRGAVVALHQVFVEEGEVCWQEQPTASDWLCEWLLAHFTRLHQQDQIDPDTENDHMLGEAIRSLGAMLASRNTLLERPTPTSRGVYRNPTQVDEFRQLLREVFAKSSKRPELLLASCDAAEKLGTPDDLRLLDEQTRFLDVQAGFTLDQTDRILQARDRVTQREPLASTLKKNLLQKAIQLGLERLDSPQGAPERFRRPSDDGIMVLVFGGSFIRGDDDSDETAPRRRVHLGGYLIDVDPVPQGQFVKWVKDQGGVLRLERGFFPVQDTSDRASSDEQFASHVTWFAAQAYSQWAISEGHLPTEAQWEKAARGTEDDRRFPNGNIWESDIPESPFGLRICHLLEWTEDAYDRLAYKRNPSLFDPKLKSSATEGEEAVRTVRGRAAEREVGDYTLANRDGMEPISGAFIAPVGFRVVVELEG